MDCGARLAPAPPPPGAGADDVQIGTVRSLPDGRRSCASCGVDNRPSDNFCKACGSPVAAPSVATTTTPIRASVPAFTPAVSPHRRGSKASILAFAMVAALLFGGGTFLLLTGGGESDGVTSTIGRGNDESNDQNDVDVTTSVDAPPVTEAELAVTTTLSAQVIPTTVVTSTKPNVLPGDLGLAQPISKPPCDDTYITIVASALNPDTNASVLTSVLERYPGSAYLKTSETCPSLRPSLNGEEIYVAYFGPFQFSDEACAARSKGPADAYVRILSLTVPDTHRVTC